MADLFESPLFWIGAGLLGIVTTSLWPGKTAGLLRVPKTYFYVINGISVAYGAYLYTRQSGTRSDYVRSYKTEIK